MVSVKSLKMTWMSSLIALAAVGLMASCGEDEEKAAAGPQALSDVYLDGTWVSECLDSDGSYEIKQVVFEKALVVFTSTRYSDEDCESLVDTVTQSGVYSVAGLFHTTKVSNATAMDYLFHSATWSFSSSPSDADVYAIACSSTASGNIVDILDKTCDTGENEVSFYREAYGTAKLLAEGLAITDFNYNGNTEEDRGDDLNPLIFLVKQEEQQQQQ